MSGARRFLHTNLNTADAAAASAFYRDAFGLRVVMQTRSDPVDGALYGTPGVDTHSDATFLYDDRGPRQAVGLELQEWYRPPVDGELYADVRTPGMQALGLAVPTLDGLEERVVAHGGRVVARLDSDLRGSGEPTMWIRDRDGVLVEVAEQGGIPGTRLQRLVVSTADVDAALRFYAAVGFGPAAQHRVDDAPAVMPTAPDGGGLDAHDLRLPDDPGFALLLLAWDEPAAGAAYDRPWHRGLYRCALAVDDVRAEHARLVGAGFDRVDPPTTVPMAGTKVGDLTVCFLRDPFGVTVELVERPRAAFA
ncbi:MAG TPA: VOC family protein [Mycobacteriales bacterium]|nr:VOC family protein [Mycobacteriales bacterium]